MNEPFIYPDVMAELQKHGTSGEAPPLGLKPRWLAEEQRLAEVELAILRYREAGKSVPTEWMEEHSFLFHRKMIHDQQNPKQADEDILDENMFDENMFDDLPEKKPTETKPRCIRGRVVVNDVNVGPWTDIPEIQPPTYDGIVKWMRSQSGYDPDKLSKGSTFDPHIINYEMRYQFWVPQDEDDLEQTIQKKIVICKDDCGNVGLTKGEAYTVIKVTDDGMIRVISDDGKERDYFPERFNEKA